MIPVERDDLQRVRTAQGKIAGGLDRLVVQLFDSFHHPGASFAGDVRVVIDHPGDRLVRNSGFLSYVIDGCSFSGWIGHRKTFCG